MSSSASRAPGVYGGQLCPDRAFLSLPNRRHVAALCMLYKVNSVFSELPSASVRGVEHFNLQGVSCRPRLVCGMTFPTLCLAPER